jgi:hypothetical protein
MKPTGISHTIIPDVVHRMRQFWSMRSNKWQHAAQSLRFEWPPKRGIIRLARDYASAFAYRRALSDAEWQAPKPAIGRQILYTGFGTPIAPEGSLMAETVIKLRLNQQQLELMDRTIAQGVAADRVALVRLALREYAAARKADAAGAAR